MKVLSNATPVAIWHEVILEAEGHCGTHLQTELEAYLVFMLVRYMNQPSIVQQIMASHFLEAIHAGYHESELLLQRVGDICLLFSGFFPGIAEKRKVNIPYFIQLGRTAYSTISQSNDDIYHQLDLQFVPVMDVLQAMRQYSKECPDLLPLQAYELWHECGSQRAFSILQLYSSASSMRLGKK